ncbi:MAG: hypothetical protein ACRELG_17215, partial [Gemmataceae bacterium]
VGAACALARAACFLGEERYAASATQSILTLLEDTVVDARDTTCRHTSLPSPIVNRLGTAALLVLAINELPAPQKDLLDKSEQMCNWIRHQARADGSLRCRDDGDDGGDDADSVAEYPGLALYAVLRSAKHRPAAWKMELAHKAVGYYRSWWRQHPKNPAFVPWQTAACAEAYLRSKEAAFAEFVYEMNDWVCTLQYDNLELRRLEWYGGFMKCSDGKAVEAPPTIESARCARGLAEALRATRVGSDVNRDQRYNEALRRALQFVERLQYTEANTQHFENWYRRRLVGGFHASPRDGELRLDYTQHAVSALVTFLEEASPVGQPRTN